VLKGQGTNSDNSTNSSFNLNDFNLDPGDSILFPVLNGSDSIPKILKCQSYLGKNPTGTILTNLICKVIPLNKK
jgi:hypothetical protein